jgi:hypothetical protein
VGETEVFKWLLGRPELAGWAITLWLGWKAGSLNQSIKDLIECHQRNEAKLEDHERRLNQVETHLPVRR